MTLVPHGTKKHIKNFLWSSNNPKIAHSAAISDWKNGGFKFRDLDNFLEGLKIKFLTKLNFYEPKSWMLLPIRWICDSIGCPVNYDILTCNFNLPSERNMKGNPFYSSALKTYKKITDHKITMSDDLYNTKIWYNRDLQTNFIASLKIKGFEFLKDLFPGNRLIGQEELNERLDLTAFERQQINSIKNRIPNNWLHFIAHENTNYVTQRKVKLVGNASNIFCCKNKQIYEALIRSTQQIPTGFERWCLDLQLDLEKIDSYFLNPRRATNNSFSRCFQYKILTKILPTKEYLLRYQAPDIVNNICPRCDLERHDIEHCLFECDRIQVFLTLLTQWIQQDLLIRDFDLNLKTFLFGNIENSKTNKGLEHILIEAKKYIFYELAENKNINADLHMASFKNKIKNLIAIERKTAENRNNLENFLVKWECCEVAFNILDPDVEVQ